MERERVRNFTAQLVLLNNIYRKNMLSEQEYKRVREYIIGKHQQLLRC